MQDVVILNNGREYLFVLILSERNYIQRRDLSQRSRQIYVVKNVVRVRVPLIRIIRSIAWGKVSKGTLIILADAWQINTIGETDDVHLPGSRDGRKMTNGYVNCERARIAQRIGVRRDAIFTTVLKLTEIRRSMKSVRLLPYDFMALTQWYARKNRMDGLKSRLDYAFPQPRLDFVSYTFFFFFLIII